VSQQLTAPAKGDEEAARLPIPRQSTSLLLPEEMPRRAASGFQRGQSSERSFEPDPAQAQQAAQAGAEAEEALAQAESAKISFR
jgi:hypothetical protein